MQTFYGSGAPGSRSQYLFVVRWLLCTRSRIGDLLDPREIGDKGEVCLLICIVLNVHSRVMHYDLNEWLIDTIINYVLLIFFCQRFCLSNRLSASLYSNAYFIMIPVIITNKTDVQ